MKKILFIENVASIKATSFYLNAAKAAANINLEFHIAYNAFDRNINVARNRSRLLLSNVNVWFL